MCDPKDVAQEIVWLMPRLMRRLRSDMRSKSLDIDPSHFRFLALLSNRPLTISELASKNSTTLATISNTVKILEDRGWVNRSPSPADRRMVIIGITDEGRRKLEETHSGFHTRWMELLSALSSEELDTLLAGMKVLNRALSGNSTEGEAEAGMGCAHPFGKKPTYNDPLIDGETS